MDALFLGADEGGFALLFYPITMHLSFFFSLPTNQVRTFLGSLGEEQLNR